MAIYDSMSADKTITVQDFIAMRNSDEITYHNYSIISYLNGFDFVITNILYDYEEEFQDLAVTITLTDLEKIKYRYKPDLFAFDLYGSTETKFIIMMINGIIDPKEFDFNKVKALRPSDLSTILGRITTVNEDFINKNRSNYKTEFKAADGNSIWIE